MARNFESHQDSTVQTRNVTGFDLGSVPRVSPLNVEEIRELVLYARANRQPLYPVSTGLNWGYGSKTPTHRNSLIVDLSAMNRIISIGDLETIGPAAIIEPGVTQGQLHAALETRCPGLFLNVTGSSRSTSVLGCSLDRGIGYYGPRSDDILGLEVVCGNGKLLRTGCFRGTRSLDESNWSPQTSGPDLTPAFLQSSFGIVTKAAIRLHVRRPTQVAVAFSVSDEQQLPRFIKALVDLQQAGVIRTVPHIANRDRTVTTISAGLYSHFRAYHLHDEAGLERDVERTLKEFVTAPWSGLTAMQGSPGEIRAAIREVRRQTAAFSEMHVMSERRLSVAYQILRYLRWVPRARRAQALVSVLRPLQQLTQGKPTDLPVVNLLHHFSHPDMLPEALDQSRCGLIYVSPVLPPDGQRAVEVINNMKRISNDAGQALYVTLNLAGSSVLIAITNLLFDRSNSKEVESAHRTVHKLSAYLRSQRIGLYRLRADDMAATVDSDDPYWPFVSSLKSVFDPDRIIAPGRYDSAGE